jgi:hypothetical protein
MQNAKECGTDGLKLNAELYLEISFASLTDM